MSLLKSHSLPHYCTAEIDRLLCDSVGTLLRLTDSYLDLVDSNLNIKYKKSWASSHQCSFSQMNLAHVFHWPTTELGLSMHSPLLSKRSGGRKHMPAGGKQLQMIGRSGLGAKGNDHFLFFMMHDIQKYTRRNQGKLPAINLQLRHTMRSVTQRNTGLPAYRWCHYSQHSE